MADVSGGEGGALLVQANPARLLNTIVARYRTVEGTPSDIVLSSGGVIELDATAVAQYVRDVEAASLVVPLTSPNVTAVQSDPDDNVVIAAAIAGQGAGRHLRADTARPVR